MSESVECAEDTESKFIFVEKSWLKNVNIYYSKCNVCDVLKMKSVARFGAICSIKKMQKTSMEECYF